MDSSLAEFMPVLWTLNRVNLPPTPATSILFPSSCIRKYLLVRACCNLITFWPSTSLSIWMFHWEYFPPPPSSSSCSGSPALIRRNWPCVNDLYRIYTCAASILWKVSANIRLHVAISPNYRERKNIFLQIDPPCSEVLTEKTISKTSKFIKIPAVYTTIVWMQ